MLNTVHINWKKFLNYLMNLLILNFLLGLQIPLNNY